MTVNGNLIFKGHGYGKAEYCTSKIVLKQLRPLETNCGSGFLEEGGNDTSSDYTPLAELLKKLKKLPKSYGVYYNMRDDYFPVDFNTGEVERMTKEELINRFG